MGEEPPLSADEQLRLAREHYESTRDFTVAVEEEFAILDPETLSLTNRFEELKAAAEGTELEPHLVGELIASEVEVRTGSCESFADVVSRLPERRAQVRALADKLGVTLGATGMHPWSPWQEQRIIDTPHYRLRDELLRYVVWRNNTFGLHVHVAIRGADRAVRVCDALRAYLPELLALSASSPFVENVNTGLHSARTQIFTRFFPRCGVPDVYGDWRTFEEYVRFLFDTGSISEHTEMWWSVRPHLAFPTAEIRICDAQPLQDEAISLAALAYALTARLARAIDEREPVLLPPNRLIEENFWRAIRWGLSGELIDLRTLEVRPARAAIEELIEWVQPVAEELGAAEYLAVPAANAAERQIARFEEGATLEEIYAEQVRSKEAAVGG
ncbi:MAG TPA: YbdK family carboxylate-amine ligase [Gaiellaceae bacterium]|nr:YbdK family carboxylate-amine ligase [Gaiellaceae bacterium]